MTTEITKMTEVRAALAVDADALARRLGVDDADRVRLAAIVPLLGPWSGRASDRVDADADGMVAG